MGYSTDYVGDVQIVPPLSAAEASYLRTFAANPHDYDKLPGVWCQWEPTADGAALKWDGNEKFYEGPRWMVYLIDTFLRPGAIGSDDPGLHEMGFTFDHVVNGEIEAQGEDRDDTWQLVVVDNAVFVETASITYGNRQPVPSLVPFVEAVTADPEQTLDTVDTEGADA